MRLTFYYMRFNSFNVNKLVDDLIDYIFLTCDYAKAIGYDGFRDKGFGNISSSFFSFVFLCGGNFKQHTSRDVLTPILQKDENIKLIISENLENYRGDLDLLTFESVLECISKMILIPVESFGTACELGAFTVINNENNKVVAIIDSKYATDKSFINYGPIQYLRGLGNNRVIETSFVKKGNKTHLITNSSIEALYKNELITSKVKIKRYFKSEEEGDPCKIVDLNSFLFAILDLACLLGFINTDIVLKFFSQPPFNIGFEIDTPTIKNDLYQKTIDIIECSLKIFCDLNFFTKHNNFYIVNQPSILSNTKNEDRWIGKILFTNKFTRTDEYLAIKCKANEVKEAILK